jgi:surfactin synthase thioesterase subunit
MTPPGFTDRWLPMRGRTDPVDFPLLCLPHAGGAASAYGSWLGRIPGVAVLPLQPPGRESRFREPAYERMAPLVEDLGTLVLSEYGDGRPYAVYGHSHGALIAFELTREIRRRGGQLPVRLFVSGSAAPQCEQEEGPPVTGMSRPELVAWLRRLGGTPEWLLADPGALDMVLPAILADFTVREHYAYTQEPPLEVPVTVLASTGDSRASYARQSRWREQTSISSDLCLLDGGHFAVFEQPKVTHRCILDALRPVLEARTAELAG